MLFADDLAARRDLDPAWVKSVIGQARYSATVVRLLAHTVRQNAAGAPRLQ